MVQVPNIADFTNLVELAQWQAQNNPDRIAVTFLPNGDEQAFHLTYGELDQRARTLAAWLQKQSFENERALLLYPPGMDFIVGLYGCLYAGITVVLAGLPNPNASLDGLRATAEQSQAKLALTTTAVLAGLNTRLPQSGLASLCWLTTDQVPGTIDPRDWRKPRTTLDSLAMLIYTSGSTSSPKGVMIPQRIIFFEMKSSAEDLGFNSGTIAVSMAPMYHIGGIFLPLIMTGFGFRFILMPTRAFIERPIRWLEVQSRYQATISFSFNFGLQSCVERTTPEERAQLDLSHLQSCYVGGERLRSDLMEEFIKTFTPHGFRREVLRPSYGLTESMGPASATWTTSSGFRTYALDQAALEQNRVLLVDPQKQKAQLHVGCGKPVSGKRVAIVDPVTREPRSADRIGEIWISTDNISQGYWNMPEESAASFQMSLSGRSDEGRFFRTGDMGFLLDDDLVITGRIKEMVILHGKNYYSQDLEKTVEGSHPALVVGSIAAVPWSTPSGERLAIACEIKQGTVEEDYDQIISAVRKAIAREQQQAVTLVALVKASALPRSTSGKLLRFACREFLQADRLEILKKSILEDSAAAQNDEETGYAAPSTPIERALAGIWCSILGKARIGVQDNFFELGGDSLTGTQILAQVQDVFQVDLPAQSPFDEPTIAGMARMITQLRNMPGC